ncbi:MAG: hypothetical protein ACREX9_16960, partial [Gammaproteobacteria bacterium]
FRNYWVLAKLLLTILATIVLLLKMEPISYLAGVAAETTLLSADLLGLRVSLMAHAGGGLLVLLAATTLAVYKPRGMTRYGARKQHEQGGTVDDTGVGPGADRPPAHHAGEGVWHHRHRPGPAGWHHDARR